MPVLFDLCILFQGKVFKYILINFFFLFGEWYFLCGVYVFISVGACVVCACVCVPVCMCRAEVDIRVTFSVLLSSIFWGRVSHWTPRLADGWALKICLSLPTCCSLTTVLGLQVCSTGSAFSMLSGDPDSGPHVLIIRSKLLSVQVPGGGREHEITQT